MSTLFNNHAFLSQVLKHNKLPIYITNEFDFYRCVNIDNWVYGKTLSTLHSGNLRSNNHKGRFSKLFPNEKISYWADSPKTALAEIRKHGGNKNYLTFWAYDDVSSTFPMLGIDENLIIIDGRDLDFHKILQKIENDEDLSFEENNIIEAIKNEKPDCLAYWSVAKEGNVNFLFFEKGFRKLALKEVKLYLGERNTQNTQHAICAVSSDYSPVLKGYGQYFEPTAKLKMDVSYIQSEEYKMRCENLNKSTEKYKAFWKKVDDVNE